MITLPQPSRWHPIVDTIVHLEKLRTKVLWGDVPPYIFFQLKAIFHMLETLWSARIEWNNTTLAEYVESLIESQRKDNVYSSKQSSKQELINLEEAIKYIEEWTDIDTIFTRKYVSDLHILVTRDLPPPPSWEGSRYPWAWRPHNVQIKNASHIPPDSAILHDMMEDFFAFLNADYPEKDQLLMVAIAHHRFAHIHPFDNGNGRMGRLLNYALLIKLWFQVKRGRILNPSAVFYTDRNIYYDKLWIADSLSDNDILDWSNYFLTWLRNEIEKIDTLLQKDYVVKYILSPALHNALDRKFITDDEHIVLQYIIQHNDMIIKAEELDKILWITNSVQKSRFMNKLKTKWMIQPITPNGRVYTIHFSNNYLLRSMIDILNKQWFVADFLNINTKW